jgi:LysM repeat protein
VTAARLGAALVAIAAIAPAARADDVIRPVVYRVKQGDTLELIAAEFYGDRTKAVFILDENKLTHARPLRPGERLRIPVSHEITTSPSDTLLGLAKTYLGNGLRSSFLADWNGLSQDDSLPAGMPLTIPFTIVHTATTTESISDIAKAYFGDGKNADMLRRYNQLDRTSIEKGEPLIVPAYHVRLSPAKQPGIDAEARGRRDHRRDAMARAVRALPAARQAWRDGDFAGVKAALAPSEAELDYLDTDVAVDIAVLLGATFVAFNDVDHALTCFQRAVDRQHDRALRRYDYSPKILAVWEKARGPIE